MAVTPNYNWPLPDDTSLVKDGAEAIRDLGNAIDTTVEDIPLGGLVHIESRTISAVASESFNDVFSATFRNYLIRVNVTTVSEVDINLRLRASGSDDTNSNYKRYRFFQNEGSAFTNQFSTNTSMLGSAVGNVGGALNLIDVANPQIANHTQIIARGVSTAINNFVGCVFTASTTFDGFTLLSSSNMTGTIKVYGYKD